MFLESICDDPAIIEANVRSVKISSPDYVNWDQEKAVQDFYNRIKGHEQYYEPIENPSFPYIKVINVGQQIIVNNIQGYLQSRIVFFLMNIHNRQRTIYFARAGEALIDHLYKADADLSSLGWQYAQKLCSFLMQHREEAAEASVQRAKEGILTPGGHTPGTGPGEAGRTMEVWTSARKRSAHTALAFADQGYRVIERSQLSEINPGVVDGLTPEEISERFPDEWDKKINDPYGHRYPRAESYHDLSIRLEPIIFELERATSDVLIVGQSSVLRCLIAYCQGRKPQEIPGIQVKEGELWEMVPKAYGMAENIVEFWDQVQERQNRDEAYYRERQLPDKAASLSLSNASLKTQRRVSLFRPCIDIHEGQVKQIVGGTLDDQGNNVKTNFVATHSPAYYADLYQQHGLVGGHVIKLGPRNDEAALEALRAWPDSLQVGGGITEANAQDWLNKGASKVIVTSYLFPDAKFSLERLQALSQLVGRDRLVVDVSCRRKGDKWVVAMNRWQDLTDMEVNAESLHLLAQYCSEFLVHAADVEGLCQGIDQDLVAKLAEWIPDHAGPTPPASAEGTTTSSAAAAAAAISAAGLARRNSSGGKATGPVAVTYAGGARHLGDLELVDRLSRGKVDLTFGSALDIFGGSGVTMTELVQWNRTKGKQGGEQDEDEEGDDNYESAGSDAGQDDQTVS